MFKILNRGNSQVIETVCEAFGALKYKGEFKASLSNRVPNASQELSVKDAFVKINNDKGLRT
jgi:hypothetical protein